MSWENRVIQGAYTSPSGERLTFDSGNVSQEFDKKTTAFDPPTAKGTYVQDLGATGRRYPLVVFFWGADHDLEADKFLDMLSERGQGTLEHPFYGLKSVVPFGNIRRRDDLVTSANQSAIQVLFFETDGIIFPNSLVDPRSEIENTLTEYNNAASEQTANDLDLGNASKQVLFRNDYQELLNNTTNALETLGDQQNQISERFNTIKQSILTGLNILVGQPLDLAFQSLQLIQEPARAVIEIEDRIESYIGLTELITEGYKNVNDFYAKKLFSMSSVTGQALTLLNGEFETKPSAIGAAEELLNQFDIVSVFSETGHTEFDQVDTGEAYQQLQKLTALTAGFLVELSFNLKQEVSMTLDRDRNIVELVADLYGDIDENLDFFINSNRLTGSEILELPRGRTVVYYI